MKTVDTIERLKEEISNANVTMKLYEQQLEGFEESLEELDTSIKDAPKELQRIIGKLDALRKEEKQITNEVEERLDAIESRD